MSKQTESLEERKKRLEAELETIQTDLERSMGQLKGDIRGKMSVTHWVKKYPLQCIGAGVMLGFMLAGSKKKRKRKGTEPGAVSSRSRGSEVLPMVGSEIKRMLTRKATNWLVDRIDEFVDSKLRSDDGEETEKPADS